MELREKIAAILDPIIVQWDEGDPLKFADAILAIPELQEALALLRAEKRKSALPDIN